MSDSVPVNIPKVSMAAEEVVFVEWLAADGQQVAEGENIYSVETEKVEVEIEAVASGILRHGDVAPDESRAVGAQIGMIELAS